MAAYAIDAGWEEIRNQPVVWDLWQHQVIRLLVSEPYGDHDVIKLKPCLANVRPVLDYIPVSSLLNPVNALKPGVRDINRLY